MKIDRHNYEEFFILYMDGELSMEERQAVEAFAALHPDLKEELDLLQQFKLQPDTDIVFKGKDELFRINGETPVTMSNYDEWFAQYIDNELNPAQKKAVEDFIAQNPDTAKELLQFERTKLQPETILFADKASLYRSEKERRVVPMRWWRIAVAAVLVIGLGIATYSVLDKKSTTTTDDGMAGTQPAKSEQVNQGTRQQETITPDAAQLASDQSLKNDPAVPGNESSTRETNIASKQVSDQQAKTSDLNSSGISDDQQIANNKKEETSNNLPKPLYNPNYDGTQSGNDAIASVEPAVNRPDQNNSRTLTNDKVTTHSPKPSDYITASNNPINRGIENPDEPDGKKNRLRGFFRKVTRTFEKRTNIDATDDDNNLLVAGLAIKLR